MNDLAVIGGGGDLTAELLLVDRSHGTNYGGDIKRFVDFARETGSGLVDAFKEYAAWLKAGPYKPATVNRSLSAIRSRMDALMEHLGGSITLEQQGAIRAAMAGVKNVKRGDRTVGYEKLLSYPEIEQVIRETPDTTLKLVMEFLARTGLRIAELVNLRVSDCQELGMWTRLNIVGKGEKERTAVHVRTDLVRRVRGHFGSEVFLFEHTWRGRRERFNPRSLTTRIGEATERVLGPEKRRTAHAFRHSFATRKIHEEGLPVDIVSRLLGHSDVSVTLATYSHPVITPEMSDVEMAI